MPDFVTSAEFQRHLERLAQDRTEALDQAKQDRVEFREDMLRAIKSLQDDMMRALNSLEKVTANGLDVVAEKQDKTNGRVLSLERELAGVKVDHATLHQSVQEHHAQSMVKQSAATNYTSMLWAAFIGSLFTGGVTVVVAWVFRLKP